MQSDFTPANTSGLCVLKLHKRYLRALLSGSVTGDIVLLALVAGLVGTVVCCSVLLIVYCKRAQKTKNIDLAMFPEPTVFLLKGYLHVFVK